VHFFLKSTFSLIGFYTGALWPKANGWSFARPFQIDKTGKFIGDYHGTPEILGDKKRIKKAEPLLGSMK
jgi:hypothetical protein